MKAVKLLIAILVLLTITSAIATSAFAQQNFKSGESVELSSEETVSHDYFASGKKVVLNGTVEGDAFIAGGDVTVNGVVTGDLIVAGGNLNLNGEVDGNIRVAGGNINISGNVGKNVTALGGDILFTSEAVVNGSLVLASGQVNVEGSVGRDIVAGVGSLSIGPSAVVNGDVTYWSQDNASISAGSVLSGNVTQNIPPKKVMMTGARIKQGISSAVSMAKVVSFLGSLIVGLIFIRLLPNFTKRVSDVAQKRWPASLGIGFITLAATPFLVILLLLTIVGIPFAIVWVFFIVFGVWLAKIFVSVVLGEFVAKLFKQKWNMYLSFSIGLAVFYIFGLVPFLGWIFSFLAGMVGLGALVMTKKAYFIELRAKKLI